MGVGLGRLCGGRTYWTVLEKSMFGKGLSTNEMGMNTWVVPKIPVPSW